MQVMFWCSLCFQCWGVDGMNFLFSTDPSHLDGMKKIIKAHSPLPIVLAHAEPEWGAVVATGTPYAGLNPLMKDGQIVIVLGDPLVDLPRAQPPIETGRTLEILKEWTRKGTIYPEHAATLVKIDLANRSLSLVTDCCSFIPAFIGHATDALVLSNSPDLVENVVRSGTDPVAFRERLAALQNAFPYTLYKGVRQLHPGAVTTITGQKVSVERWWSAPEMDEKIDPSQAREELHGIASDQIRRMVAQVGPKGALTMSAGADSRFAAACATLCGPENLTAICQTAVPDLESETARQVANALGMNFTAATRPHDHYPKVVLGRPFYMGSHIGWDHGHFAMGALGDIGDARFLLGGYWSDSLFDDGDIWNTFRWKFQSKLPQALPENSRVFAASEAFHHLSDECRNAIGERWQAAGRELGLGPGHSPRLAGIYPASRSLAAGHVAAARYFYPDYQLFMNRRSVELAFRLSSDFKKRYGKSFLLSSHDDRLKGIPVNPGQSAKVRSLIARIQADVPAALWPDWVRHRGSWRYIEGRHARRLFRTARTMAPRLADALDLPAAAVPFRRNLAQATRIFQLGQVMGV